MKVTIRPAEWVTFLLTIGFLWWITMYKLGNPGVNMDFLGGYFSALGTFFWNNILYALVLAVLFWFFWQRFPNRNASEAFKSFVITSFVLFIAAGLGLLFIVVSAGFSVSPTTNLGLVSNSSEIAAALQKTEKIPEIVISGKDGFTQLIEKQSFLSLGSGSFYKQFVSYKMTKLLAPDSLSDSTVYLLDNKLIFTGLSQTELENISPRLGYLLVKNYFDPRFIKDVPKISILGRQDYLKKRDEEINKQLLEVDNYGSKVDTGVKVAQDKIEEDKKLIETGQLALNTATNNLDLDYKNCIAAGYYDVFVKKFIPYHEEKYCKDKANLDWGDQLAPAQKKLDSGKSALVIDQKDLDTQLALQKNVANYRSVVASQKNVAPDELGLFHDQTQVDVVLDWVNSRSAQAYMQTLAHEYLHYTSYVSEERKLPRAFEEALTELYAKEVMKKSLGQSLELGYPLLVKVMTQMATKLPADSLQTVYFTKDERLLANLLDQVYGSGFYAQYSLKFEVLPFLAPNQSLATANELMGKIGGRQLTEKDMFSELTNSN